MVEAGLGIGMLPRASMHTYSALAIQSLRLDEVWARRELELCVRSYDALPVAAQLLFDHLRSLPPSP
jgi:DNA-binding transcriptional LysR family regulator